jgi:hypothetical protein
VKYLQVIRKHHFVDNPHLDESQPWWLCKSFCYCTEKARKDQVQAMLREACLTKGVVHSNVAAVTGIALQEAANFSLPLVLYAVDSVDCHNLKTFLHRCRIADVSIMISFLYILISPDECYL